LDILADVETILLPFARWDSQVGRIGARPWCGSDAATRRMAS